MSIGVKCPACGGQSFTLFERLELAHEFRVEGGAALPMQQSEDMPIQIGFTAKCDCGHFWTPRRATAYRVMDAESETRP